MTRSRGMKRPQMPGSKAARREARERKQNAAAVNRDPTQVVSIMMAIFTGLIVSGITYSLSGSKAASTGQTIHQERLAKPWELPVATTAREKVFPGCNSNNQTVRHIRDDFFTQYEVDDLLAMMKVGMKGSPETGGPTIMDLHSGLLKDGAGVVKIYEPHRGLEPASFSKEQLQTYLEMFDKIKQYVEQVNGLESGSLYFTGPTFVARLVGNSSWQPLEIHDEYWHAHVDKDNTDHYDYSGLVYLSNYGTDFTGGEFRFIDDERNTTVLPRRGRLITFSSGKENLHEVAKVKSGSRFTLSMWFTCDPKMRFDSFYTKMQQLRDEASSSDF